jgi:hypothetical protein
VVFHHLVKLSEEEPRCSVKRVSGLFTLGVFLINFTQLALLNFCSFHVRLDHSPPIPPLPRSTGQPPPITTLRAPTTITPTSQPPTTQPASSHQHPPHWPFRPPRPRSPHTRHQPSPCTPPQNPTPAPTLDTPAPLQSSPSNLTSAHVFSSAPVFS